MHCCGQRFSTQLEKIDKGEKAKDYLETGLTSSVNM